MRSMGVTTIAVALLAVAASASLTSSANSWPTPAARCEGGVANPYPLTTTPPVFVSEVPNGKRYLGGAGNDTFHVSHLYGTPYEQGYAMGQLYKTELPGLVQSLVSFAEKELLTVVPWLPKPIAELIAKYGGFGALQYIWDLDEAFMPQDYKDEIQGMADSSGVSVAWLRGCNMLPELTKAACTILGAYGKGTEQCTNAKGGITHLRGLDFVVNASILNFAAVTIYHNPNASQPSLANFGWIGMTGVLTGITSDRRGVGEKDWGGPHHDGWVQGEPWMYLLRDLMTMPGRMPDIVHRIETARKTTDIHVGIGSQIDNLFLGFEIAPNYTKVFNATTFPSNEYHPDYTDVVYWERDLGRHTFCYADLLKLQYGNLSAEFLARTLAPMAETGETHMAAFDYTTLTTYFAIARKTWVTEGPSQAYARPITRLDMAALFAEPRPNSTVTN